MRWLRTPLAAFLLGLLAAPALATPVWQQQTLPITTAKPFGPGSPGYLPMCSGIFAVDQELKNSAALTTAPWTLAKGTGDPTTTLTATTTVPDPLGGQNAWDYNLPSSLTVGSPHNESIQYFNFTYLGGSPQTADVYVMGTPGQSIFISVTPNGSTFEAHQQIVFNGKWQRVSMTWTPVSGSKYFEIGWDFRDAVQAAAYSGTIPAQHIYVYGPQIVLGSVELPFATTTSTAQYNSYVKVTANCPPGTAFRNFSGLAPATSGSGVTYPLTYAGLNALQGNTGGSGGPASGPGLTGIGPPMVSGPQNLIGGTWYGLANCIATAHTIPVPWSQCLYTTGDLTRQWTFQGVATAVGTIQTATYSGGVLTLGFGSQPPYGATSMAGLIGTTVYVQGLTASACTGACPTFPGTYTIASGSTSTSINLTGSGTLNATISISNATIGPTASLATYNLHAAMSYCRKLVRA